MYETLHPASGIQSDNRVISFATLKDRPFATPEDTSEPRGQRSEEFQSPTVCDRIYENGY